MKKRVGGARLIVARLGLVAVVLVGCAGLVTDVHSLVAQGYQPVKRGSRLWWKETRAPERRAHFCFVPTPTEATGYNWTLTVLVDGKKAWEYESGSLKTQTSLRTGIDCVDSRPLPEGKLEWRGSYVFWH